MRIAGHVAHMHEKPQADDKTTTDTSEPVSEANKYYQSQVSVLRLGFVGGIPAGSQSCTSQL